MKKNKQNFIYQNKIILTNGASIKLSSTKYFKIYHKNPHVDNVDNTSQAGLKNKIIKSKSFSSLRYVFKSKNLEIVKSKNLEIVKPSLPLLTFNYNLELFDDVCDNIYNLFYNSSFIEDFKNDYLAKNVNQ